MKLSRYNIEKKEDKSCLIYNTVTSAILELDTDYEKSYYEMKEGKKCSKPDLESALLEGGMLVEDDKDEFAELLIRNKIERFAVLFGKLNAAVSIRLKRVFQST